MEVIKSLTVRFPLSRERRASGCVFFKITLLEFLRVTITSRLKKQVKCCTGFTSLCISEIKDIFKLKRNKASCTIGEFKASMY